MKNIKFLYLYRDGGNYKSWAEVVFSNPAGLSETAVTCEIQRGFMTDGLFVAHQIRIPEVFPYFYGDLTLEDHCFHEFDSIGLTAETPNDSFGRSISEFLTEATRQALAGWHAFEPCDRSCPLEGASQPSRRE